MDDHDVEGGGAGKFLGSLIAAPVLKAVEAGRLVLDTAARHIAEHRKINLERYKADHDLLFRREALQARMAMETHAVDQLVRIRREEIESRRRMVEARKEDEWRRLRFHHEQMLNLATRKWEAALHAEEHRRVLDQYAIKVLPSQLLPVYAGIAERKAPVPLLVLLSPPDVAADAAPDRGGSLPVIERRLTDALRGFTERYSSADTHPVRFLGGAWRSKASYGEAAVEGLFGMLPSIPTLVLESEIEGGYLSLRFAYWGLGEDDYTYRSVLSRVDTRALLRQFARETAAAWREARVRHLGETSAEALVTIGGVDERNLHAYEEELRLAEFGTPAREQEYVLDDRHYSRLERFLSAWHCLVCAWIADSYHLFHSRQPPRLPSLLPSLLPDLLDENLVASVVSGYGHLYDALAEELEHWIPELQAELAQGLGHLADKRWALRAVRRSMAAWLGFRGVPPGTDEDSISRTLEIAGPEDEPYLRLLRGALGAAGRPHLARRLNDLLDDWRERRQRGELARDHIGDTLHGAIEPK